MPREFTEIHADAIVQLELARDGYGIDVDAMAALLTEAHVRGYDNRAAEELDGFQLATRFGTFMERLAAAIEQMHYAGSQAQQWSPWLYACYAFAQAAQEAGAAGLPAIKRAVAMYEAESRAVGEDSQRRGEAHQAEFAEAQRKHELAVRVECPYCGAQPGATCRTAGPSGRSSAKGIYDHTDRYRAASNLLKPHDEASS